MKTLILEDKKDREKYLSQAWEMLKKTYENVAGGLHFENSEALLNKTHRWHLALENDEVLALTVFKAKLGWKLTAMAKSSAKEAKNFLKELINKDLAQTWMELSEKAENFVLKDCEGYKYLKHASQAQKLLNKEILVLKDGFHYERKILGLQKAKIIVGTTQAA